MSAEHEDERQRSRRPEVTSGHDLRAFAGSAGSPGRSLPPRPRDRRPTLRRRLAVMAAFIVAVVMCLSPAAHAATTTEAPTDMEELAGVVQELVDEAAEDGIRVSVGLQDVSGLRTSSDRLVVGSPEAYNPASTIKLALLATVMRQADRGYLNLDAPVTVSPYMVVGGSGTIQDEEMPYTTTVRELARLMVVVSDNTATNVLLYYVGIPTVQELLDDLGLTTMRFNRQMFPGELISDPANVIDAADTVALLDAIYAGDLLSESSREQVLEWMLAQEVDTKFGAVLGDAPVAHKTGETGNVTHDVGYLLVPGHETIVAVFTEVTTTSQFSEAQRIGNPVVQDIGLAIYQYLTTRPQDPEPEPAPTEAPSQEPEPADPPASTPQDGATEEEPAGATPGDGGASPGSGTLAFTGAGALPVVLALTAGSALLLGLAARQWGSRRFRFGLRSPGASPGRWV